MVFVFLSSFGMMTQFLSAYLTDSYLTLATISLLYLIYQITKLIFEIPTGYIADKYGRKLSSIIDVLLFICSYLLLITNNTILFYISFFIKGLAVTFVSGSMESIFVDNVDKNKLIQYNTIERLVFYTSLGLSAFVGGFIISLWGYLFIIVIDLISMVLLVLVIANIKEKQTTIENSIANPISFKDCLSKLTNNKTLLFLLLIDLATAFAYVGVENLYPAFLSKLGVQSQYIGIFISCQFIISAILGLLVPSLTKKINGKLLFYILPACRVFILIPIYFSNMPIFLIPVLYLANTFAFVLYAPIKYDLFQKNIPSKYRATIISMQSQAIAIGAILFYGISSILSNVFTLSTILIIALLITFILNASCCYTIYRENNR